MKTVRTALLHMHIFKNAGTSFDDLLRDIYSDRMVNFDTAQPDGTLSAADVLHLAQTNPEAQVISSHQARFPVPVHDEIMFLPAFFLRHPIARVQSCFHFEKDVQSLFPEDFTLEQYVRNKLQSPRINAVFGLQIGVLADNRLPSFGHTPQVISAEMLSSAKAAVRGVPAFGIVEHFSESLEYFSKAYSRYLPELEFDDARKQHRSNAGKRAGKSVAENKEYLQSALSESTYIRMLDRLKPELELYDLALNEFEKRYGSLILRNEL